MTYNKKHKSYKKGKGTTRRRSSFDGNLLRALPTFILLLSGVLFVAINLGLKSFLFPSNKTELNEYTIPVEQQEFIESEILEAVPLAIDTGKIDEEVFTIVQEMPRFPGCEDLDISIDEKKNCAEKKMLEFIYKNINYPAVAPDTFDEMTVISFIVNKEGDIENIKLLRGSEAIGKEYIRIVKSMPRWIPGKQRGEPANVQFNLPIRIKLES